MKKYIIYLTNWDEIRFETSNIDHYLNNKPKWLSVVSSRYNHYFINTDHIVNIREITTK